MRDFNSSTDRIDYNSPFATNGQPITIAAWANFDVLSPGASSRFILNSAVSGGATGTVFAHQAGVNGGLQFIRVRAGGATNRIVNSNINVFTNNVNVHVAAVDTGTLSSGNTTLYVNGVAVGLATDTAGSGTEDTANTGFSIGGRSSADDRNFDGKLGHVAVWNRALSAGEVEALAKGASPFLYPASLRFYARLDGADFKNLLDGSGTLDGTTDNYQARVLTFRPRMQRAGLGPAVGATPTISSTSDTNTLIDESALTINGANLAAATAVTFKQTDRPDFNATAYIATNGAASIVLSAIDIQIMGYAYGAATVEVTTAGGTSSPFAITISPASGTSYVTLAGHTTGTGYATDLASANGDQLTYPTTVAGSTVSVDADGTIAFTPAVPDGTTFTREWFDASSDAWTTDTVQIDGGEVSDGDAEFLFRRHRYLAFRALN